MWTENVNDKLTYSNGLSASSMSTITKAHSYLVSVGTAFPDTEYTQAEVADLLKLDNPVVERLLRADHIKTRRLTLPPKNPITNRVYEETPADLQLKFKEQSRKLGKKAIDKALAKAGMTPEDIGCLICITSTGFMVPGLSSLLAREIGFRKNLKRSDIVGMGCNAGLNGLNLLTSWVESHPDENALLLCCEINSASYVLDGGVGTGIVNSLFGDGAAVLIVSGKNSKYRGAMPAQILDFESFCISEHWDAMRFNWNAAENKWSFFLSREIPFVIGENVNQPVLPLLQRHGLELKDIPHWIVHTGGGAVIAGVERCLGLEGQALRHTKSVLRDFGNISSGSFIVSFERLIEENNIRSGDHAVMLTMGPGAQIEAALLKF